MHAECLAQRSMRRLPVAGPIALTLALAVGARAQTAVPRTLQDLAGIEALRAAFNDHQDAVRVVMLLSPT